MVLDRRLHLSVKAFADLYRKLPTVPLCSSMEIAQCCLVFHEHLTQEGSVAAELDTYMQSKLYDAKIDTYLEYSKKLGMSISRHAVLLLFLMKEQCDDERLDMFMRASFLYIIGELGFNSISACDIRPLFEKGVTPADRLFCINSVSVQLDNKTHVLSFKTLLNQLSAFVEKSVSDIE